MGYHMDISQDDVLQLQALIRASKALLESATDENSKTVFIKLEKMRKILNHNIEK